MSCGTAKQVSVDCTIYIYIYNPYRTRHLHTTFVTCKVDEKEQN